MNLGEYMRSVRLSVGGAAAQAVVDAMRANPALPVGEAPRLGHTDLLAIENGRRPAGARVLVHWTAAMRRLGADVDEGWLMRAVERESASPP